MTIDMPTEAEPVRIVTGDCLQWLPRLPVGCVDAVVTDPPYGLSFMGKAWDHGVPGAPFWEAVLHTLKPGGYMLAMGGTRTYHRLACAIEDAGFQIRDCLNWQHGSGFPKGKGCLKPAWEPILLARKPGPKVLPLGIDACRVGTDAIRSRRTDLTPCHGNKLAAGVGNGERRTLETVTHAGRWPANVLHDGSDEVMEAYAAFGESGSNWRRNKGSGLGYGSTATSERGAAGHADTGTAARFFYAAKASRAERGEENGHPTVKPIALMRWLVRLVARPGEIVLDPFAGSGSTLVAAVQESCRGIGIEREPQYVSIARKRVEAAMRKTGLFEVVA